MTTRPSISFLNALARRPPGLGASADPYALPGGPLSDVESSTALPMGVAPPQMPTELPVPAPKRPQAPGELTLGQQFLHALGQSIGRAGRIYGGGDRVISFRDA